MCNWAIGEQLGDLSTKHAMSTLPICWLEHSWVPDHVLPVSKALISAGLEVTIVEEPVVWRSGCENGVV